MGEEGAVVGEAPREEGDRVRLRLVRLRSRFRLGRADVLRGLGMDGADVEPLPFNEQRGTS